MKYRVGSLLIGLVAILSLVLASVSSASHDVGSTKPPAGGYFAQKSSGAADWLDIMPTDAEAAAAVHQSTWEPRSANTTANNTIPPQDGSFNPNTYAGLERQANYRDKVTGNYKGTTDEIIQWTAVKWGLSDEWIRAELVAESSWYQNRKRSDGTPYPNYGYGDYGDCPATTRYPASGPASYGLPQIKWCQHKDSTTTYGGWPWIEDSSAYAMDYFGSIMRACLDGHDYVTNTEDDLRGCIGRWYAGDWYSAAGENYYNTVKSHYDNKPWLGWANEGSGDGGGGGDGTVTDTTVSLPSSLGRTEIKGYYPTTNFASEGYPLVVDGDTGGGWDEFMLLRFDMTQVPAGKTIKSAQIKCNVTDSSSQSFNVWAFKKPWVNTEVTWRQYRAGYAWEKYGAAGSTDRETSTRMGYFSASGTGTRVVSDLSADGRAVVKAWADGTRRNDGLIVENAANADGIYCGDAPVLVVVYS